MRESAFRKRFGKAVKAARDEHGMTQRELSEAADIAEKYLSRVELGIAMPSVYVVSRLAQALGIGVDDLLGSSKKHETSTLGATVRLLRDRTPEELETVRRIVAGLFR